MNKKERLLNVVYISIIAITIIIALIGISMAL